MDNEKFSEEDLNDLTEQERAELLADEDDDEAAADAEKASDDDADTASQDDPDKPADTGEEADDTGADEDTAAKGDSTADDTASEDGKPDDAADKALPDPAPSRPERQPEPMVFEAPANATERLAEIEKERTTLRQQLANGELTDAEYFAKADPLEDERNDIRTKVSMAEASETQRKQTLEARAEDWFTNHCKPFLEKHSEIYSDDAMRGTLDAQVRALQNDAVARGQDMFAPSILDKAHRMLSVVYDFDAGESDPAAQKDEPGETVTERPKGEIPPTLGGVPAAASENTDGDRFAHIDRLTGEEQEQAIAKMTEAEQEAYLSRA